jgi:hypothetical protein
VRRTGFEHVVRTGNRDELNIRRQLRELIRTTERVLATLHDESRSAGAQQFGRAAWAEQRVCQGKHGVRAERACGAALQPG